MTKYVLSEGADRDLDGIWDNVAEDSIDAADRWMDKLFDAFDAIGETRGIGHRREDLTAYPVLFWPVGALFRRISISSLCLLRDCVLLFLIPVVAVWVCYLEILGLVTSIVGSPLLVIYRDGLRRDETLTNWTPHRGL